MANSLENRRLIKPNEIIMQNWLYNILNIAGFLFLNANYVSVGNYKKPLESH
jgi:hypothetical protein